MFEIFDSICTSLLYVLLWMIMNRNKISDQPFLRTANWRSVHLVRWMSRGEKDTECLPLQLVRRRTNLPQDEDNRHLRMKLEKRLIILLLTFYNIVSVQSWAACSTRFNILRTNCLINITWINCLPLPSCCLPTPFTYIHRSM
jgi:hypothetical protein